MIINNVQTSKIPCSVLILTFNSGNSIDKCLASVRDFAEIIMSDGGSTDATLDIGEKYNCKIISQDKIFKNIDGSINDFSGLRNQLIVSANYDWVKEM
jgi:glycosyltransferase involved in cell wall biosynthesis